MKKVVLFLIGVSLLILLLWRGDLPSIIAGLNEIELKVFCSLCFLQLFTIIILNVQWMSIAKPIFPMLSFKTMLSIQMVGTFFESITPAAKTGGEAVKAYLIKKQFNSTYGDAAAIITVQKLYSMVAFIPISLFSILYLLINHQSVPFLVIIVGFTFLVMIVATLTYFLLFTNQIKTWLRQKKFKWVTKFTNQLTRFEDAIKQLLTKRNFILQLIIAMVIWLLFPLKAFLLSNSLQLDVNFLTISAITFLAYMVAMLPLTPGGLGTFEGSTVLLLSSINVGVTEALLFALLLRFVTYWLVFLISAVYGVILYANKGYREFYFKRETVEESV